MNAYLGQNVLGRNKNPEVNNKYLFDCVLTDEILYVWIRDRTF